MKTLRTLTMCILIAGSIQSQTELLTNQDVIGMVNAGLSTQLILKKINSSGSKFMVAAQDLADLKNAKVPEDVIAAMMDRAPVGIPASSPGFSESGPPAPAGPALIGPKTKQELLAAARTIALEKSSVQPSRQALEKELLKRADFRRTNLSITRYKDDADLYVEIGYVSLSWLTHRYVYRIFDRRTGTVLAAGETTSWGSLAENLARHISKSLAAIR